MDGIIFGIHSIFKNLFKNNFLNLEIKKLSKIEGLEARGWQAACKNYRERMAHLLMSEEMADIFFTFTDADGTTQVDLEIGGLLGIFCVQSFYIEIENFLKILKISPLFFDWII